MFGVVCFRFGNGRICFVATVSLAKLRGAVSQQLSFSAYERCKNPSAELQNENERNHFVTKKKTQAKIECNSTLL